MVLGGTERELLDQASRAQFLGAQLFETRHDASSSGDGDQFDFRTADPPNVPNPNVKTSHIRSISAFSWNLVLEVFKKVREMPVSPIRRPVERVYEKMIILEKEP